MSAEQVLNLWIREEQVVLDAVAAGPGPGIASPDQLVGKTGLDIMQGMIDGTMPIAEIAKTLSFNGISVGQGCAVFQGHPQRGHLNPMGTVHGGWISALIDAALGSAVMTTLSPGFVYTTVDLTTKFLRPLYPSVERVRVEAKVTQTGRVSLAEASLLGPDGTLFARATTECRIFKLGPQQAPSSVA